MLIMPDSLDFPPPLNLKNLLSAQMASSPKRKASVAGLPAHSRPRPVKRRASKACCCCRARKVRCDVVESGSPCTNCRLDQVDCVVTESKRRKKSRVDGGDGDGDGIGIGIGIGDAVGDDDLLQLAAVPSAASPGDDGSDELNPKGLFRRSSDAQGRPDMAAPVSPTQRSVDLDQGQQHMPHLLCTHASAFSASVFFLCSPALPVLRAASFLTSGF